MNYLEEQIQTTKKDGIMNTVKRKIFGLKIKIQMKLI